MPKKKKKQTLRKTKGSLLTGQEVKLRSIKRRLYLVPVEKRCIGGTFKGEEGVYTDREKRSRLLKKHSSYKTATVSKQRVFRWYLHRGIC